MVTLSLDFYKKLGDYLEFRRLEFKMNKMVGTLCFAHPTRFLVHNKINWDKNSCVFHPL